MLHICCIRAGEAFSPAYVTHLKDMVARNLEEGFAGNFVCFTDRPQDLEGIKTRPLPADLPGWWSKLALFKHDLFSKGDRVLFFDLDTLITGPIDELASYDGPFAILRDFYRPLGFQSSVMAWQAGEQSEIWNSFERAGCPMDNPGGDQWWIERHAALGKVRLWQSLFPEMFVSYKQCKAIPDRASVIVFHGKPRPHEVTEGWVPQVWKQGGITRAELTAICNTSLDKLLNNVRGSIKRDLDWFETVEAHDGHVAIIGGGPSLKNTIAEVKWRQSIGQTVWALNNTGPILKAHGIAVDAQIILDARPENAGFITQARQYLIASQCAPEIFDALEAFPVTLWHVNSPGIGEVLQDEKERPVYLVGAGTTVGINAVVLAFLRGYRKIHLYGFDSSYRGDLHHAYPQPLNDAEIRGPALYGSKEYICANWMIGQAQEFMALLPDLEADGCTITVHGDGLLPDIARDLSRTMTPAETRAHEVLSRTKGCGVEIGVFAGAMSRALLTDPEVTHLTMVDSWEGDGEAYNGDSGDFHATLSQATQDAHMQRAAARVAFAGDRATIVRKRSVDAARDVPDGSCDFVFIDADHSYDGCKADIEAWAPKVKPGGWLCGHDYENIDFPKFGVTSAVDEFARRLGRSVDLGENFCWFIQRSPLHQSRIPWPKGTDCTLSFTSIAS